MDTETIIEQIIALLENYGTMPSETSQDRLTYRYLDAGHIGSFMIMNFILQLEETFNIALSPEDTQSDAFRYVAGLATIIQRNMKAQA